MFVNFFSEKGVFFGLDYFANICIISQDHLRSPNFEIAEDQSWSDKIKVVWQFLYKYYDITDDPGNHTYIHADVVRKS